MVNRAHATLNSYSLLSYSLLSNSLLSYFLLSYFLLSYFLLSYSPTSYLLFTGARADGLAAFVVRARGFAPCQR